MRVAYDASERTRTKPWRRDSHTGVSGEAGAVQSAGGFSFQRFWYRDFFSFQRLCDHSQSGGAAWICASTRRA